MFNKGDRVRVTDKYPLNVLELNLLESDRQHRGKVGTVVNAEFISTPLFVNVLFDENASNPDAWGCFYPEELELVNAD